MGSGQGQPRGLGRRREAGPRDVRAVRGHRARRARGHAARAHKLPIRSKFITQGGGVAMPSKAVELRELPDDELLVRIEGAKEELFNLRFQLATGQLDNPMRIKQVRHDVARLDGAARAGDRAGARHDRGGAQRVEEWLRRTTSERPDDDEGQPRTSAAGARCAPAWSCPTPWTRPWWSHRPQVRHPLYGKTVRRSSKLAAHDEAERRARGRHGADHRDAPASARRSGGGWSRSSSGRST